MQQSHAAKSNGWTASSGTYGGRPVVGATDLQPVIDLATAVTGRRRAPGTTGKAARVVPPVRSVGGQHERTAVGRQGFARTR